MNAILAGLLALLLVILGAVLIVAAQDRPLVFQVSSELVVLDVIAPHHRMRPLAP